MSWTDCQEDSTMRQRETKEQRLARNNREFEFPQNRIKVARLRDNGSTGDVLIPTQSFWLRMCREECGTTHEETETVIKDLPGRHYFRIEICGSNVGFGVILRDSMRSPIVAISRVSDNCVSPFYHELQGLSLGLNLAVKYRIIYLNIICISERLACYVMESWSWMGSDCCPRRRDNPNNPIEKKKYCVDCAKRKLAQMGESKNADKILQLTGEIFNTALEFVREGFHQFHLEAATKWLSTKAVRHLANSGLNQELRLPEIGKDEEIAEIFYKEVYRHGSAEELMLQKQQLELRRLGLH
ncbi:hypothetical protein MKX03_036107 [Papaver bracteatum]|nr:hypothetical protein MKX03_036107 [Papaver bracteatum]